MKSGKYVSLGKVQNLSISYGSVNTKQLKSVFIKMQCWVEPNHEETHHNWDNIIATVRRDIRLFTFHNVDSNLFRENFIVDLDLRSSGIHTGKRSFLSCDVTLYPKKQVDIKSEEFASVISNFTHRMLNNCPTLFNEFTVYERKKSI